MQFSKSLGFYASEATVQQIFILAKLQHFMKVLLDTNFIITCAKQKIDFSAYVNGITSEDVSWIVPQEVLTELRGLMHADKTKKPDKMHIGTGLQMVQDLYPEVLYISDKNTDVDTKIVNYLKDNPHVVLATLDKGLKSRVKNRILAVRGKRGLEIV